MVGAYSAVVWAAVFMSGLWVLEGDAFFGVFLCSTVLAGVSPVEVGGLSVFLAGFGYVYFSVLCVQGGFDGFVALWADARRSFDDFRFLSTLYIVLL